MEENNTEKRNLQESLPVRPFILTVFCLFSFVFFGLIAMIFLLSVFYSSSITEMVLRYTPETSMTRAGVFLYTLGGFLFHVLSLIGTVFIWKMKRKGYVLFGISTLIIAGYQLSSAKISPLTTVVYVFLIITFGVFLRKMR